MYHPTTVENFVRGDTGVSRDAITSRLRELGEGEAFAWKRYSMLGGGEIAVIRRGGLFEVAGQTVLTGPVAASS